MASRIRPDWGATVSGGDLSGGCAPDGCGAVFELSKSSTETVLHAFTGRQNKDDGFFPYGGVLRDAKGSLYGTTAYGGRHWGGTAFKVTLTKNGSWKETLLHSFGNAGGRVPGAGLIRDTQGSLYGTTYGGGFHSGTVFRLSKTGKETVLHSFCPEYPCTDGQNPYAGLIEDAEGNLYGTTVDGGSGDYCNYFCGVVFKLSKSGKETVLHNFCSLPGCADGEGPLTGLMRDSEGNLYGTTYLGGEYGAGVVFKLSESGKETVLYNFCSLSGCADGAYPLAGLIRDAQGNLYGTTAYGGSNNCALGCGTVFELSNTGTETVLYSFTGSPDGAAP